MKLYYLDILLSLLVLGHLLYQRRPTQSLIIWLLVVLLLPFVGALIYLLFGSRKIFARKDKPTMQFATHPQLPTTPLGDQVQALLTHGTLPPATPGNAYRTTLSPQQAGQWFFEAIDQAKESIWLESYIFNADATGRALLDRLTEKARQGVEVKLLLDAFGSWLAYLRPSIFKAFQAAGGQVAFFQPPQTLLQSRINLRTHRKIYLFDQKLLLSGGINLAAEYLGPDQVAAWVDLTFQAHGPVVTHYAQTFAEDWRYTTGENLNLAPTPPAAGTLITQAVPSGPDVATDPIREALMLAFYQAQQQIWIVTPYFVPDEAVLEAVLNACKRGVEVHLLTPAKTDHLIFDLGRAPYMRELHEAGARIHCYQPTMLHAKTVIVDDEFAMIGSANLDYRSLLINYELVSFVYDPGWIRQLHTAFTDLLPGTQPYVPDPSPQARVRENITRIVTPIL